MLDEARRTHKKRTRDIMDDTGEKAGHIIEAARRAAGEETERRNLMKRRPLSAHRGLHALEMLICAAQYNILEELLYCDVAAQSRQVGSFIEFRIFEASGELCNVATLVPQDIQHLGFRAVGVFPGVTIGHFGYLFHRHFRELFTFEDLFCSGYRRVVICSNMPGGHSDRPLLHADLSPLDVRAAPDK